MIERLMNSERLYEGPRYCKPAEEIVQIKKQLCSQLDQQGKEQLEQLTNAYLEQIATMMESAFIGGFCAAVDLARDYLKHTTANPRQPPES